MRYDRASFHAATKGESTITLHFIDTIPGAPQMDDQIHRQVTFSFQDWAKLVLDVEKISGIKEIIHALNYGTIPDWHPGRGDGAFIFVDEILID